MLAQLLNRCSRHVWVVARNLHGTTKNYSVPVWQISARFGKKGLAETQCQLQNFECIWYGTGTPITRGSSYISKTSIHSSSRNAVLEDRDTKALTVWGSVKQVRTSPLPALTLGLAGLVPFVGAPLYMISSLTYLHHIATAQMMYGACILSFLGGVRWGFTLPEENPIKPDWKNLGYSVVPSLVAWTGLMLPHTVGFLTVIGGLMFAGYFDMAMYGYPGWFKGLRFLLSFIAVLSLWTTLMCSLMLANQETGENVESSNPQV